MVGFGLVVGVQVMDVGGLRVYGRGLGFRVPALRVYGLSTGPSNSP